jgi:Kynureninase
VTNWEFSLLCAKKLDKNDELNSYRNHFYIPNFSGKDSIYFSGNSLGLQPKKVHSYINQELKDWSKIWSPKGI